MTLAQTLVDQEAAIRMAAFLTFLAVCAGLEAWRPARPWREPRSRRWPRNLLLLLLDTAILRLLYPVLAVGMALWAQERGFGLFHLLDAPPLLAGILSFLALDFTLYAQHRLLHAAPLLWRLHRAHHLDADLDVTSGVRFHPLEMVFSMAIKLAAVAALGAPAVAVVLFEILLNGSALFTHSNLHLGDKLDAALSRLIITPAAHRRHHSTLAAEHNRNFGFFLSLWDRLLGTFLPGGAKLPLELGLGFAPGSDRLRLPSLIADPFLSGPDAEAEQR